MPRVILFPQQGLGNSPRSTGVITPPLKAAAKQPDLRGTSREPLPWRMI